MDIVGQSPPRQKEEGIPSFRKQPLLCLLPSDRTRDAEARSTQSPFTFFASVSRAKTKEICKDTGIICISDNVAMAGVFDGFGNGGEVISNDLGKRLLRLAQTRTPWLENSLDSKTVLRMAISFCINSGIFNFCECGSTATMLLLHADGRFSCSQLGDSPAYGIGKYVDHVFDPNIVVMPTKEGMVHRALAEVRLSPDEYFMARNVLLSSHAVTKEYDGHNIRTRNGRLAEGSLLMLASDCLPKNLFFETDSNGFVRNTGGCRDMDKIVADGRTMGILPGEALVSTVQRRILATVRGEEDARWVQGKRVRMCADDDFTLITLGIVGQENGQ